MIRGLVLDKDRSMEVASNKDEIAICHIINKGYRKARNLIFFNRRIKQYQIRSNLLTIIGLTRGFIFLIKTFHTSGEFTRGRN